MAWYVQAAVMRALTTDTDYASVAETHLQTAASPPRSATASAPLAPLSSGP